ncbi:hypothetical protein Tfer_0894 [Thermincola ferriacetica]|uniref:Uncharacterized protein n=1 Tax=Thermincola ferriacetica TaxID=281456 RepID=A0A0L6W5G2_9FIRM|nr:hypothetical protein [Thermincola ferriacetica]KNZ70334.1 hypothetical protein Tfer_0894 [Thermincola ferriacetica]
MKEIFAKLMLVALVVFAIRYFIYDHLWNNVKTVDTNTTSTVITNTQLPTP